MGRHELPKGRFQNVPSFAIRQLRGLRHTPALRTAVATRGGHAAGVILHTDRAANTRRLSAES